MSSGKGKDRSQNRTFIDPAQAPFLQQLYQRGFDTVDQASPGFQQNVVGPAQQAFGALLQPGPNPELGNLIQNAQFYVNENLQENLLPAIGDSANLAGQLGGTRQGVAEGIVTRDANRLSGEIATNLTAQDFDRRQQQLLATLSLAPQIGQLPFIPLDQLARTLGRPTVLGEGQAKGDRKSVGII